MTRTAAIVAAAALGVAGIVLGSIALARGNGGGAAFTSRTLTLEGGKGERVDFDAPILVKGNPAGVKGWETRKPVTGDGTGELIVTCIPLIDNDLHCSGGFQLSDGDIEFENEEHASTSDSKAAGSIVGGQRGLRRRLRLVHRGLEVLRVHAAPPAAEALAGLAFVTPSARFRDTRSRMLSSSTTKENAMNNVMLIGNLATEVEVRDLGEDRKVANFLLAVDRPNDGDEADFVRITAWNRQAEVCAQFLAKGRRVAVEGRLRSSSWEDAEGKRRTAIEVVARSVEFLSPPDRETAGDGIPFEAAPVG